MSCSVRSIVLYVMLSSLLSVTCAQFAFSNPTDGQVSAGEAAISQPNATTTQIDQTSQKAIIDWQKFNIAPNETTRFNQPNASSITLNRINGLNGGSQIMGRMTANGQIWLINPAGIIFGKGAQVNAAGLFATTSDIKNEDFMSGNYKFTANPLFSNGAIINEGTIEVQQGGLVGLVGTRVENRGVIRAQMGTVLLGGAEAYALDFDGDQLINFVIEKKSPSSSVVNTGNISVSPGQTVLVGTGAAKSIVEQAINMTGVKEATHVSMEGGVIMLDAGEGTVQASGKMKAAGGIVAVKGKNVIVDNAKILTSSRYSGGLIALLGKEKLTINNSKLSSNSQNLGGSIKALSAGNIAIAKTTINANGSFGGGVVLVGGNAYGQGPEINASNTYVDASTSIKANALSQGNGGKIVIWSDGATQVYGSLSAKGGVLGGNGGWIETSGHYLDVNGISISTAAPAGLLGTWLLDPTNIYIATSLVTAQAAGMSGADVSASLGTGGNPNTFQATGAVQDSLLTISTLQTALTTANVIVTTTNASGTGLGNITIVDPVTWAGSANSLTLTAANNIAINALVTTGTIASALILDAAGTVTQTANIAGAGGVTQLRGTVQLNRANTYTGATIVSGGTMVVSNATGMGTTAGGATVAAGATLNISAAAVGAEAITLNGGTLLGTGAASHSGTITLGANSTIQATSGTFTHSGGLTTTAGGGFTATFDTNGGNIIQSGAVSGLGSGLSLTKNSGNTLTLSVANTYIGATTINAGTLVVSNATGLGTTAGSTTIESPGTLQISGVAMGAEAITINGGTLLGTGTSSHSGTLTLGANSTIQATSGTFTRSGGVITAGFTALYDTDGGSITQSGAVSGSGGVTKTGGNILTLSSASNAYTGGTAVNAGTLRISNANALGSGGTQSSGVTIASGATLDFNFANNATLGNTNTITATGTGVGGVGAITGTTAGTNTVSNAINLTGNTTIGGGGTTLVLNGVISGGFNLTKLGSNTVTLGGSNSYTGTTTVSVGTLKLTNANALGSGATRSSAVTIDSGATLDFNFATNTLANTTAVISVGGTGVGGVGALTGTTSTDTVSNPITLTADTTIGGAGNLVLGGDISGGAFNITKAGANTLTLGGSNSYSGTTSINAGTLSVTNVGGLGAGSGAISLASGTTLSFNIAGGGTLSNTGGITLATGTGNITNLGATGTTTLNNAMTHSGTTLTVTSTTGGTTLMLGGGIINNGSTSLTITGSGATTASGSISGSGNLIKSGAGTLTLSNANSYTGTTSVTGTGSTLNLTHIDALGSGVNKSSAINIATASILRFDLGGGTLGNDSTITLTGTAALTDATATGTDTINNPIVFAAGATPTFTSTNSGSTFSLTNNVTNSTGLLTITGAGNTSIGGVIGSSSGGLTKSGAGTLTLSGANTYTGATTISAGTVTLSGAGTLGSNSAVNLSVSGATLNLGGDLIIGSLTGVAGTSVGLGSNTLTTGGLNTSLTTYTGILSGTGGKLTKTGTGVFNLAGANTYTGATTISNGTLRLSNANALGSGGTQSSAISIASGATLESNFNGTLGNNTGGISVSGSGVGGLGAIISSTNTGTMSNNITLLDDTTLGGANSLVLNGIISGGFNLTKLGVNTVTFGGSNSYTGTTTVSVGTLKLTNANALGSGATRSSAVTIASGATLDFNFATNTLANTTAVISVGGTGVGGVGALTGTTSTDTVSNAITLTADTTIGGAGNLVLGGDITGGAFNITKAGANTLTLGGSNSYSGTTSINAGTLSVTNIGGLGAGSGAISLASGTTLSFNIAGGGTLSNTGGITLATGTGNITNLGATGTTTLNNAITHSGTTLTVTSTTGGTTLVLGGSILNNGSTSLTITGSGATTASGSISGSGNLIKSGAGTLTLSNANSYTGTTSVTGTGSTLNLTHIDALGSGVNKSSAINIATASILRFDLGGGTLGNDSTITLTGTAALTDATATGTDTINNPIVFAAGATPTFTSTNSGSTFSLTNNVINSTGLLTITGAGNTSIGGVIGSSSGGLTKSGAGTLTLSGANTYTGATTVSAGTLAFAGSGTLNLNSVVNLSVSGATLSLGNNLTIGSLTGVAGTNVDLGSNTLTTGALNTSTIYTGSISGTGGGLTKDGTGTFTLAGANTYTGATTVNAGGALRLTNANALGSGANQSSSITIASGASLEFNFTTNTLGNNTATISVSGTGASGTGALLGLTSTDTVSNHILLLGDTSIGGTSSLVLTGVISDGGNGFGLTKLGTNIISLGGENTFKGATLVSTGTLRLTNANALGLGATQSSDTTVSFGATLDFSFLTGSLGNTNPIFVTGTGVGGVGALTGTTSTDTLSNAITLTGDTTIGGAGNLVLSGVISDGGNGYSLTKTGINTLTLGGANTYTGMTTISNGTLSVTNTHGLGTGNAGIFIGSARTLSLNLSGNTLANQSLITFQGTTGNLTNAVASGLTDTLTNDIAFAVGGTPTITSTNAGATFELTGNMSNSTGNVTFTGSGNTLFSGVLGGDTGGLIKSGAGTLTLTGLNTYSGITSVTGGTLSFNTIGDVGSGPSALGAPTSIANGTISLTAGEVLLYTGSGHSSDRVINIAGSNAVIDASGTGPLILTGGVTSSGGTNTLVLRGSGFGQQTGPISSSGGLTKSGTGTWTLSGANTYPNTTTINNGTLIITHSDALSTGAINIAPASATVVTLDLSALSSLSNPNTITLNGDFAGSSALLNLATITLANNMIFQGESNLINVGTGQVATLNGTLNGLVGERSDVFLQGGGTITLGGIVGGTIPLTSLTLDASTTLDLNTTGITTRENQIYSGVVSSNVATTFTTTVGGDISLANPNNNFSATAPLSFVMTGGGTATLNNLNGVTLGASDVGNLTVTAGGNLVVSGAITSASNGAITLTSPGILTLDNTISGGPITLSTQVFINNAGSSALNPSDPTTANRFLVYSVDPANDVLGGLAATFVDYGITYPTAPSQSTGNGFLYSVGPPPPPPTPPAPTPTPSVSEPVISGVVLNSIVNGILSVNFVTNAFISPYPVGIPVDGSEVVSISPEMQGSLPMNAFPLSFASSTSVSGLSREGNRAQEGQDLSRSILHSLIQADNALFNLQSESFQLSLEEQGLGSTPSSRDEEEELKGTRPLGKPLIASSGSVSIPIPYALSPTGAQLFNKLH